MQPYEKNSIRVNADDLPLDALVNGTDKTIVPYYRSGLLVNFDIHVSRNVIVELKTANGEWVPAAR